MFSGCFSLVSIDLRNVTSLGSDVFSGCSSLVSIDLRNVTSLGSYVFEDCSSLVHVDVPLSITSINTGAFSDCTSLDSMSIPSNVNEIRGNAFLNCSSLKYVIIPDAAIDNINYGTGNYGLDKYKDPFTGCKILERIAKSFKILVKEYFRAIYLEKVKLRAVVLNCLKLINARRMRAREEGKKMKWGEDGGGIGGVQNVYISDQCFKGVYAESKITAFEMWREILMFV